MRRRAEKRADVVSGKKIPSPHVASPLRDLELSGCSPACAVPTPVRGALMRRNDLHGSRRQPAGLCPGTPSRPVSGVLVTRDRHGSLSGCRAPTHAPRAAFSTHAQVIPHVLVSVAPSRRRAVVAPLRRRRAVAAPLRRRRAVVAPLRRRRAVVVPLRRRRAVVAPLRRRGAVAPSRRRCAVVAPLRRRGAVAPSWRRCVLVTPQRRPRTAATSSHRSAVLAPLRRRRTVMSPASLGALRTGTSAAVCAACRAAPRGVRLPVASERAVCVGCVRKAVGVCC